MAAFPDSQQVYHQLRWDSRFSPEVCAIVLVDREGGQAGTKTIAFREFIPNGPIPWHRIVRYLLGGEVLWDRQARVDRRTELLAAARPVAQVAPSALERTPLPAYRYRDGRWRENPGSSGAPRSLATWNVLFDLHEPKLLESERRWARLLEVLRGSDTDVIALTEVTPGFCRLALEQPWVREAYSVSALPDAWVIDPHGVLLLSRRGLEGVHAVELEPRRNALVARVGDSLVAAAHLKSDRHAPSQLERARDLARLAGHLAGLPGAGARLVLGDLNAGEGELEAQFEALGAVDLWSATRPGDEGFTYDPARNALAATLTSSGKRGRLDRAVLLGGSTLRPSRAALLGVESPVVSDHYGLRVELEVDEVTLAAAPIGHRSAVVAIPPRRSWGPIQRLRATFDAARFERWVPHVSVLYGFLEAPLLASAARTLEALLEDWEPLELEFDQVLTFEHRTSTTLALGPSAPSVKALRQLQIALLTKFPQCVEQNRGRGGTYTPHLTLGRFGSVAEAALARREAAALIPLRWSLDSLAVLVRPGDVFEVAHTVPLSRTGPRQQADDARAPPRGIGARARERESFPRGATGPSTHVETFGSTSHATPSREPDILDDAEELATELDRQLAELLAASGLPVHVETFGATRYAPAAVSRELDALLILEGAAELEPSVRQLEATLAAADLAPRRAGPSFLRARGFDLQVVQLPRGMPLQPLGAWVETLPEGELRRALLGPRDAQVLRARLAQHGRAEAFDALFPLVRRWSKARGLDGNAFGYFGGLGWAVLTAAPLLHDATLCRDGSWGAWCAWASRLAPTALVSLTPGLQLEGDGLRLAAPAQPPRDIARSMIASTRRTLFAELARLADGPDTTDVRDELRCGLELSGASAELLGVYQQRFLALLARLEPLASVRVVGRVEGTWTHLLGSDVPLEPAAVRRALDELGLQEVRVRAVR